MGITTLGRERATNPFLRELADAVSHSSDSGPPRHLRRASGVSAAAQAGRGRAPTGSSARAGYRRIETPTFEATELFARGVGESTDIVQKEMYTFDDGGGRSLTLRPEGTAPVCRAYLEHGMHKLAQPVKLWYLGPFFRAEAPQRGRYRQFWQVGAEAIGSDAPETDAELIVLLADLLEAARRQGHTAAAVEPWHAGHPRRIPRGAAGIPARARGRARRRGAQADRPEPAAGVRLERPGYQSGDARRAEASGPARPRRRRALRAGPRRCSTTPGSSYELDPTLVRGIDYYTRTVFEFTSDALGAQSGVGGGGRYDGLIEQLGGPPTPASAGRPGSSGCCWPRARRPRRPISSTCSSRSQATDGRVGTRRSSSPATRAAPGCRRSSSSPAARSRDSSGTPTGSARATSRSSATTARRGCKNMESGEQHDTNLGDVIPEILRAGSGCREARTSPQRLPRRLVRPADRRSRRHEARVAGWVHRRRDHGGLIFIDLRDRSGIVQLVFHPEHAPAAHQRGAQAALRGRASAHAARSRRRDPENVNPNLPTGEIELAVSELEILADADTPPFPIDDGGDVDENIRLRYRSLDLRRAPMQRGARCSATGSIATMREVLNARDFLEIETPVPDPLDARGRARLPRPGAHRSRAPSTRCRSPRSCSSSC